MGSCERDTKSHIKTGPKNSRFLNRNLKKLGRLEVCFKSKKSATVNTDYYAKQNCHN